MNSFYQKLKEANRDMPKVAKIIIAVMISYFFYKYIVSGNLSWGILVKIPLFMVAIIFHECGHGVVAYLCGDDTAKKAGRLTLNPIKHIDPLGLILPLILIATGSAFVIGWAKPIPVNYGKLKNGRVGEFLVGIAGITVNLMLAFAGAVLLRYAPLMMSETSREISQEYIAYFIMINVILAMFNGLPIPPLDGSKIVASFLNEKIRSKIFYFERYGLIVLIALSYFGMLTVLIEPGFIFIIKILNKFIVL